MSTTAEERSLIGTSLDPVDCLCEAMVQVQGAWLALNQAGDESYNPAMRTAQDVLSDVLQRLVFAAGASGTQHDDEAL